MQKTNKSRSKPNFKGRKSKFSEDKVDEKKYTSKPNDASWYVREPQLVKDVASISFNNALGAKYNLNADSAGTDFNPAPYQVSSRVPGIMSILTAPAVNPANGPYSALNIATKDLFKRVRRMNAGSTNYDSPDLMLYILAMDSIYSAIFFLQRIYGCANVYSQVNRFVGDAFIAAQGVEPYTVRSNLAAYRSRLNQLITKVSAFATPLDINLFKRHSWMYQGIYMDEPVKKAQVYMYTPAFIYKYVEDSGGPGYVKPEYLCVNYTASGSSPKRMVPRAPGNESLLTADQLFFAVEQCLQSIVESQDMNIMSGDILKAYGEEGIWRMSLIDETYATIPVFSEEVLDQIHNTNCVGIYPTTTLDPTSAPVYGDNTLQIFQSVNSNGNYLMYAPRFINSAGNSFEHLLDMSDDNPTPERVIVATRNMVNGSTVKCTAEGVNNTWITSLNTCGSDLAFCLVIYHMYNNGLSAVVYGQASGYTISNTEMYSRFHKAPILYSTVPSTGELNQVLGEVSNYTIMDGDTLQRLHETAMLSLFGVNV